MKKLTPMQNNLRWLAASGQIDHYKFPLINWKRVFDCIASAFVGFILAFLFV